MPRQSPRDARWSRSLQCYLQKGGADEGYREPRLISGLRYYYYNTGRRRPSSGPHAQSMRARTVISWRMPGTNHWSSAATTASISAPISTRFTRPADSSGASAAAPASAPSKAPSTAPVCTFSPPRFAFASRALQTSPPPFFAAERTFGTLCSRYQLTIVGWRGTRMPSADAMASARDAADPTP